ncbi:hypothetical protein OGAPHI_007154 [Ogataea philodendri]|uniref:Uncharacterized protein n=1 Tax=Ogataea philodendri TaxID=1378263 RepID=A0A9P8NVE7_9ASCO|nr:uncharacterized protein OGAPHI_007154 [Ogataea philodendri]KAH3660568.1 hypothetical protein OGAPHI_007154 [Ogataea philodendri]
MLRNVIRQSSLRSRPVRSGVLFKQFHQTTYGLQDKKDLNESIMDKLHLEQGPSQTEQNDSTYESYVKYQAMFAGLLVIVGSVGGYEVYRNWEYLRRKIFGDSYDLSHFDEVYAQIQEKQQKKKDRLETMNVTLTNPNSSEVPGLYICGDNSNKMVSSDSKVKFQPIMKRLDIFDKFVARDVVLGESSGALINKKGDLYQWGAGFGADSSKPTLKGKDLIKAQISNGVVYALTKRGEVLYFPESAAQQKEFGQKEKGWFFSSTKKYAKISAKQPIRDISAGKDHIVLLDTKGSVLTAATGLKTVDKSHGQFGIPEFSQFDAPPAPNTAHEVTLLNKVRENNSVLDREIRKVVAGNYFTMCLDSLGNIWTFGKNTYGSLGKEVDYNTEIIPYPTKVEMIGKRFKRSDLPQCVDIAAGGDTAYASFVSSDIYELFEKTMKKNKSFDMEKLSDEQKESLVHFSWGHGLKGELGNGHFVHGQAEPSKIQKLNDLREFNEVSNKIEVLGLRGISVGGNHAVATLTNGDVYDWGDNEFGQLGNGKRIRSGVPAPVPSLLEPGQKKQKSTNNRLQLATTNKYTQVVVAGPTTTAIYYRLRN